MREEREYPFCADAFLAKGALYRGMRCGHDGKKKMDLSLPYNKTSSVSAELGGNTVGVTFNAGYLVGTNFDCNHPNFAYEAEAEISSDILLFGHKINSFDASFVYGQNGGAPLADELKLSVFGKTLYDKKIPSLQYCVSKEFPLAKIDKGFNEDFTVWVSIVPIVFTADADLDLQLDWMYSICTNDLSASIGIQPSASFTFSGSAEVDLLILGCGTSLTATMGASVEPQAYIHGTLCTVGSDAVLNKQPLNGDFQAYYKWRHCKFIIWDCSWGEHHVETFWSDTSPPSSKVLYNHSYTIKP